MSSTTDVLVAGAGPAGAVAALVLARAGLTVRLMDDLPVERLAPRVGESLPGAARPLLRDLGLVEMVDSTHALAPGNVSAWGSDALVPTDFIRDPHGPGWHLDRSLFDQQLRTVALNAGAQLHPGHVRAIRGAPQSWQVVNTQGECLGARFVIDATGRYAAIARRVGARRRRDTPLIALPAWASAATEDAEMRTLVEGTQEGWWYSSRLPGAQRIAVLHTTPAHAQAIRRSATAWHEALSATTHVRRLWPSPLPPPVRAVDASGAVTDPPAGPGWLAVGDASLAFDPLSSQGLFHALYTGLRGAQAVLAGTSDALGAYAARLTSVRRRYREHRAIVYAIEDRWPTAPFWHTARAAVMAP
ncbi:tryptophan 7-halogenase [Hyalangium minutum]|uniref:Dehydrogenase flavoprotein LodB n=1 Tax=Hyalangium minutum TaxID=394096 RepID=A0A085WXD6_9BACT|nr:tryptophan 7-halogenase [Hyalangium minutum]KFE72349.1 Dehydrogenase flavoprotein LodB [Hyalangium minutum]